MSQNNQNVVNSHQVLKIENCSFEFEGKTEKIKLIHRIVNNQKEIELCFDPEENVECETSNRTEEVESTLDSSHETRAFVGEEFDVHIEFETDPNIKTAVQNFADLTEALRLSNSTVEVPQNKNIPESIQDHSALRKSMSGTREIFDDETNEMPAEEQQGLEHASVSFHREKEK